VLLAAFPLIYGLIRVSPSLVLLGSGILWLATNLDPAINLTNWLDGRGWYFDPFAWQFLFIIGAVGALLLRHWGGDLPRPLWLRVTASGYLAFALLAVAPWEGWGWSGFRPVLLHTPDKTVLAPLRLANILALAALALGSARFRALVEWPSLRFLIVCGRHSLEVFSLGTVLSMIGHLVFRTFGITVATEVLINGSGLAMMVALAFVLERHRHPAGRPRDGAARSHDAATAALGVSGAPAAGIAPLLRSR
jgi:hypothetical protein